ncbi:MAG TPA: hypothetical protein VFZ28_12500 [Burkholderiaceae bacterium]|nr:hypothetical protein [Burkholderiaceae bacterium]
MRTTSFSPRRRLSVARDAALAAAAAMFLLDPLASSIAFSVLGVASLCGG